jgi:hypothetical protein
VSLEDSMTKRDTRIFPIIYSCEGHPSGGGSVFLIEGTAFDGTVVRLAIPLDNIQHFIAFLLTWVGTISSEHSGDTPLGESEIKGRIPVRATSIGIGPTKGDDAYIGISVGRAELIFSLPASALTPIGETLRLLAESPSNPATS